MGQDVATLGQDVDLVANVERGAGNVVITPLDNETMFPTVLHHVAYMETWKGDPGICLSPYLMLM